MPGHILGEKGEGKHNSSQPTSNNLLKTSHYTHYILFHYTHPPTHTHSHHTHSSTTAYDFSLHTPTPQTRTHTYTSTADYDLSLHPPTTHLHYSCMTRVDCFCIQSLLFLNKKNSDSRDERYTIRWNKMFTFVAALISHKQIVWARD